MATLALLARYFVEDARRLLLIETQLVEAEL
jgi:hypothetical protein